MNLRFGSVCSGIEAASAAWCPLGWSPSFFSEIASFPRAVLQHHHKEVPLHGDFTTIQRGDYPDIDVLVGGTPCQSFSIAGPRGGLADSRGNLALEYLRLADRLRPRWIVWENVPGVLSSTSHNAPDPSPPPDDMEEGSEWVGEDEYDADESHAFACFLAGLSEIGYGWAYRSLDAQYFGLAQRRERVFVVGYIGDWRHAAAVLFEPESLRWNNPPSRKARQEIAPTISARSTGGGGLGNDFDCDGGLVLHTLSARRGTSCAHAADLETYIPMAFGGNNTAGAIDVATARNAHAGPHGRMDFESETFVTHSLRADGFDASEDGTGRGTPLVAIPFDTTQITSAANYSSPQAGDPCHPLVAGVHAPAVAFDCKASGRSGFGVGEVASTMRAMGHAGSHQNGGGYQAVQQGMHVRRLTPRECERLQGFPDDYTLIPWRGGFAPDGPRYKALGNSMAVPVMAWMGRRIAAEDAMIQSCAYAKSDQPSVRAARGG